MRKNKMAGLMAGVLAAALWMTGCSGNGGTETEAGGGRRGDGDRNGRNVCGERGIPGFRRREQGKRRGLH